MKLIIGLGNPGREYINTRHNAGYIVIDQLNNSKLPTGVFFLSKEYGVGTNYLVGWVGRV